jgi:HemK-like putative methylase
MVSITKEQTWLLREKYHGEKTEGFFTDCERLDAGEPVAYVIGFQPFLDVKIWLDSKPLIPRSETEYWTKQVIETVKLMNAECSSVCILDLCAGSGAIGVVVAKAIPTARVDFAEVDAHHHATITRNICDNGIDYTNTRIFGGDLFEHIPKGTQYDFILSNPPYIDPILDRAEASVKNFEPHLALYGGKSGMEIIERIIHDAPQYLAPHGQLWIEHEPEQVEAIQALSHSSCATWSSMRTLHDQYGAARCSILTLTPPPSLVHVQ